MELEPVDGAEAAVFEGRLWPGGRPFNDWGQCGYGYLDLRVFDQHTQDERDVIWCDIAGQPHRVSDMSPDYRTNVVALLEQGAPYYHLMTVRRRLIELCVDMEEGRVDPGAVRALRVLVASNPATWMSSTPVMRALRATM